MSEFEWIAVAVIATLSSARITRLLIFDKFPPIQWIRNKYADKTDGSDWQLLVICPYCMSFWVTAAVLWWGHSSGWDLPWLLTNGVFASSYLAAIVMVHDGEPEESQPEDEN